MFGNLPNLLIRSLCMDKLTFTVFGRVVEDVLALSVHAPGVPVHRVGVALLRLGIRVARAKLDVLRRELMSMAPRPRGAEVGDE